MDGKGLIGGLNLMLIILMHVATTSFKTTAHCISGVPCMFMPCLQFALLVSLGMLSTCLRFPAAELWSSLFCVHVGISLTCFCVRLVSIPCFCRTLE
jgi:hypothetical protein